MKKIFTLYLLLIFVSAKSWGQINTYSFSATSGTYTALSGATAVAPVGTETFLFSSADEGAYNNLPIGFTFIYGGSSFTTISASTNGFATLGAILATGDGVFSGGDYGDNDLTDGTGVASSGDIAPLWDDLDMSNGTFSYQTSGTAGNLVFTMEWKNAIWAYSPFATTIAISFQAKLYQATGAVQYIYQRVNGTTFNGSPSASIGIDYNVGSSSSTTTILSLNNAGTSPTASSTETATISAKPATGQVYTFTPTLPVISSFTPTSGCANTSSVTITGINLGSATNVTIGGTAAAITSTSATQIIATVGNGTTGTITVTTPVGSVTSSGTFTVNPAPIITSVTATPAAICSGSTSTLTAIAPTISNTSSLGSGTSFTNSASGGSALGPNPFQDYYGGSKQQMLITASELTAMGLASGSQISALQVQLASANTSYTLQNYTVRIQNTTATALTSTFVTNGFTTVYGPGTYTPSGAGYNNITFSSNYTWNGASNLLIEMSYTNNNTGSSAITSAYYGSTSFVSTAFYRADNKTVTNIANQTIASYTYSSRNNLKLTFTRVPTITWTPISGLYTNAAATTAYTSGTNASTVYAKLTNGNTSNINTVYTTTATNLASGCTTALNTTVTVKPLPTVSVSGTQPICAGNSANITFNFTGVSPWQFSYSDGTNTSTTTTTTSPVIKPVSPPTTTTYTVAAYSVTDGTGCSNATTSGSATVTVNQLPTASITPASSSVCEGTAVQVDITGTTGATINYKLNGNSQTSQTLPYTLYSPSNAGTYTYTLQSVTANSCTGTISNATSNITVNAYPTVNAIGGGNYIQTGNTLQLTNTTPGGVWASDAATIASVGSTSGSPVTVTGVSEGLTNINYTVTSNSCATKKSQSVRVYNPDYITQTSGTFSTASIWEIDRDDNTFVTSVAVPSGTNYTSIRVQHALTLNQDFQVGTGKSFSLITGGTMNIAAGKTFSSLGSVDFGGKAVTVKSNVTGTGAIGQMASNIANATNVTVERYTDGATISNPSTSRRAWRLVTSPIGGSTTIHEAWQENAASNAVPNAYGTLITGENMPDAATAATYGYDFTGAGYHTSIKRYIPAVTSGTWTQLTSSGTNTAVRTEQAYMLYVRGDRTIGANLSSSSVATLRATGTLLQGTQPAVPLSGGKFTLMGNPYASTIDFSSIHTYNSAVIKDQFYLWNSRLGSYGAYVLVNKSGGSYQATPSPLTGTGTAGDDAYRYIPSGSGFLVSAETNVTSGGITVREADKASGNAPPVSPFRVVPDATNERQLKVNLNLRDSLITLADGFRAKFSPDYEGNEEDNSVGKILNFNENLGLLRNGKGYILLARGEVKKTDTLFTKTWYLVKRGYQLQVQGNNFQSAPGIRAWLEDSYLQTKQELALGGDITTINFEVNDDSASAKNDRFRIVFQNNTDALPVTITKVAATAKNGGAEVSWTVANEVNIRGYTVEKSTDGGRTFTQTGTQQPARNNPQAAITSYAGFDATPRLGENLYRIRIEGTDGKISYSEIVKVTIGQGGSIRITLYPNPVREGKANLQLTNLKAGTYLVSVYTGSGQTVYQKKVTITLANTTQTESLLLGDNLAQGSYQVKVSDSKGKVLFTDKLLVSR